MIAETAPRVGNWMQTFRGTSIFPLDPREEEIDIHDIAHSLAMQCRYNGHCILYESVAEHSVYVSLAVSPENALWGLLHDASEAFICDIPRPLKPSMPEYRHWEHRLMDVICRKFGLPVEQPAEVTEMDSRILSNEREQNMAPMAVGDLAWGNTLPAIPGLVIECWSPEVAERRFLGRFYELTRNSRG